MKELMRESDSQQSVTLDAATIITSMDTLFEKLHFYRITITVNSCILILTTQKFA